MWRATPDVYHSCMDLEVDKVVRDFTDAELRGDVDWLDRALTDDFVLIGPAGIRDRNDFLDLFRRGTLRFDAIEHRELHEGRYGDSAVITSADHARLSYKGEPLETDTRTTMVVIRTTDAWRVASIHATALPF